jgi:hypothetical protein
MTKDHLAAHTNLNTAYEAIGGFGPAAVVCAREGRDAAAAGHRLRRPWPSELSGLSQNGLGCCVREGGPQGRPLPLSLTAATGPRRGPR